MAVQTGERVAPAMTPAKEKVITREFAREVPEYVSQVLTDVMPQMHQRYMEIGQQLGIPHAQMTTANAEMAHRLNALSDYLVDLQEQSASEGEIIPSTFAVDDQIAAAIRPMADLMLDQGLLDTESKPELRRSLSEVLALSKRLYDELGDEAIASNVIAPILEQQGIVGPDDSSR